MNDEIFVPMAEIPAVTAAVFRPGDSVQLHSLSRADLNGLCGICLEFVADANRWAALVHFPDGAQKGMKVRIENLKALSSERCDAMLELCAHLQGNYEKGFLIHPALSLQVDLDGGVCYRAAADIAAEEILLVMPEAASIRVGDGSCADLTLPNGWPMQRVLDGIGSRWERAEEELKGVDFLQLADVQLAVLLMHVACHQVDDYHRLVAAAWPSKDDICASLPLFWSAERLAAMRGTHTRRMVEELLEEVAHISAHVVEPVLSSKDASGGEVGRFFCAPGASLGECFRVGYSVALSRAHDSAATDASVRTLTSFGKVFPILDGTNGLPGPHPAINAEVNRGKWPFLRGKFFRDDCNLSCSAMAATRRLRAGEEILLDYGESSTSKFVLRFGAVPRQLLATPNPNDAVEVMIPLSMKPPPSDVDRLGAICGAFGFDGWEAGGGGFPLTSIEREQARRGGEPQGLVGFLQFCALLSGDEQLVQTFCETGGRLRGNINVAKLWAAMDRIFEHNLGALPPRQEDETTDLVASCTVTMEREGLQAWHEVLKGKYGGGS